MSLAKLRPMVLLFHSALSVASSLAIGNLGDVEPEEAFEPVRDDELLLSLELALGSSESLGVRCIVGPGERECALTGYRSGSKGSRLSRDVRCWILRAMLCLSCGGVGGESTSGCQSVFESGTSAQFGIQGPSRNLAC